jgi:hypothetical protein
MTMPYAFTTQRELRRHFWDQHQDDRNVTRKLRIDPYASRHDRYSTDTRIAFCKWIDGLVRDGIISQQLAQRATL